MVKIPCGICTTPIESGRRRYGGSSCDACASFFIRNASAQKDFKCVVGLNECLKNASKLGKGCRRCRYDKCLEIGMSTNETLEMVKEVKQQETPLPLPAHCTPMSSESQIKETELEKNTVFAYIIDSVLNISMSSPNLAEEYLVEANQDLLTTSFTRIAGSSLTQLIERIYYLRECLNNYSVARNEFPVFLRIIICKAEFKFLLIEEQNKMKAFQIAALLNLNKNEFPVFLRIISWKAEFKFLSIEEQNKMKAFQIAALLNLNKLGLTDNRVSELTTLSQNILIIFYNFL
uniref:Nuclear receptor domain-containing protein n=1 Tax=Panagrolaimus sp. PS1159 TaxID=55785 RepID=A0AC35EZI9_9BILA